jgi:hypothetical protein
MRQLTKRDAEAIARKLGAVIETKRAAHDVAKVYYGDRRVASFGIRRGKPGEGHDHIPGELHIGMHDCKQLAECPLSREGYFEILRGQGMI